MKATSSKIGKLLITVENQEYKLQTLTNAITERLKQFENIFDINEPLLPQVIDTQSIPIIPSENPEIYLSGITLLDYTK